MSIYFVAAICLGCFPPPPPPPPPAPCEGFVAHVVAQTAQLARRSSASVTFDIAECKTDYILVGPRGRTTFYDDVSGSVTAAIKPSRVRLNSADEIRLYLVSNPTNFANFRISRREVNASDPGITTGYYFFGGTGSQVGYVLVPFNQTLYERYERIRLRWNTGSLRKVWVGESLATLQGSLGGSLPNDITLWNATHRYLRSGRSHLQKSMTEPTGPVIEPTGAFESLETSSAYTYKYGEVVYGNAFTTSIWIGDDNSFGTALIAIANLQPTTVRINN